MVLFSLSTHMLLFVFKLYVALIYSLPGLRKKGFHNRATWAMFIATLIGFLSATLVWTAGISTNTKIARAYSINDANLTLEGKIEQATAATYVSEAIFTCSTGVLVCDMPPLFRETKFCVASRLLATLWLSGEHGSYSQSKDG